ncbi:MAG: helix-turn-helix transcriptional regulator [Oscillospiraceae bacterium]|nr:helix-turn-helix transcriptional regulator [Oscillospiraceae bacterium]
MNRAFSTTMSALRKKRGLSQRKVATDLQISQALLSHYENGAREPGLEFVCRACEYYGVSADYLLGRVDDEGDTASGALAKARLRELAETLRELADRAEI